MDSFALPDRRPVGPGEVPDSVAIRAQSQGGVAPDPNFQITPVRDTGESELLTGLVNLGQGLIRKEIGKAKEIAFVEGMSRAAQGEAAMDIAAQKPAWSQLFGEGDVVAGARAYEAMKDVTEAEKELTLNQGEYRKLPPDVFAQKLNEKYLLSSSGDPVRDAQRRAAMVGAMPGIMKAHAKEHMKWQQEDAAKKRDDYFASQFDAFEAQMQQWRKGGGGSVADLENFRNELTSRLAGAPNEFPGSRDLALTRAVERAISKQEFEVVNLLKATPGAWESIPVQEQDKLNRMLNVQANQVRGKRISASPPLVAQMLEWNTNPPATPQAVLSKAAEINVAARAVTGVPGDLIDGDDVVRTLVLRFNLDKQKEAAIRAQLVKAKTEEEKASLRTGHVDALVENALKGPGLFETYLAANSFPDEVAVKTEAVAKGWDKSDMAGRVALVSNVPDGLVPQLKTMAQLADRSSQFDNNFAQTAAFVKAIGVETMARKGYFAGDGLEVINIYNGLKEVAAREREQTGKATRTDQELFDEARITVQTARATQNPLSESQVKERVEPAYKAVLKRFFGSPDEAQGGAVVKAVLASKLNKRSIGLGQTAHDAAEVSRLISDPEKFQRADGKFLMNLGAGPEDWTARFEPSGEPGKYRRATPEWANKALDKAIESALGSRKLPKDSILVMQPMGAGGFKIQAMVIDDEGRTSLMTVTQDMLLKHYKDVASVARASSDLKRSIESGGPAGIETLPTLN